MKSLMLVIASLLSAEVGLSEMEMSDTTAFGKPCRNADGSVAARVDTASYKVLYDRRLHGVAPLLKKAPVSLRYESGQPALRLEKDNTGFIVEGFWSSGVVRAEGYLSSTGRPTGHWTFRSAAGEAEWKFDFPVGASLKRNQPAVGSGMSIFCDGGARAVEQNGKIELSCILEGKQHGLGEIRDFSGGIEARGNFLFGNRVGIWTHFERQGCLQRQESYVDGVLSGPVVEWMPSGDREYYRGQFLEGYPHGLWVVWCGKVQKLIRYDASSKATGPVFWLGEGGCSAPYAPYQDLEESKSVRP